MRRAVIALAVLAVVCAVDRATAADAPALVNYQGVLRNSSDKPQTGAYDMVFRFFDASSAGNEVLVDSHTSGGANAVTVNNGLFSVSLGGGTVTDGAGPGTYTSLAAVFRDYGAVWLQIEVGGEVLTPRIRVQSAAYALNASNLQGLPASSFLDVSSSSQTKAGHLVVSAGIEGDDSSNVGVQGIGGQSGGTFANQAITAVAHLGYNYNSGAYGVHGQGSSAGGWFQNWGNTASAYLAQGNYGITANGTSAGGFFSNASGDSMYAAPGGYGTYGYGTVAGGFFYGTGVGSALLGDGAYGVNALGSPGGYFADTYGASYAYLGDGGWGVYASGSPGGHFQGSGAGYADIASGDFGILGYGLYSGAGGYFADPSHSGKSWIGFGDYGLYGIGSYTGGYFTKSYSDVQVWLGSTDHDGYATAVYGYSNSSVSTPGYFRNDYYGSDAHIGDGGYKILGNGSVNFVQNHPSDPGKVIVYAAPEGDEVAVYTRGSAKLQGGEARVALGETFAWVTNPDLGLTVNVTPRGRPAGLYVASVSPTELVVRSDDPASRDAAFDYMVWGLRIGFEDRAVVQPKRHEAFIPSHRVEEDQYAAAPELRRYSALSRYTRERQSLTGSAAPLDLAASKALEQAIHVYDPATDSLGPRRSAAEPAAPSPPAAVRGTPAIAGSASTPVGPAVAGRSGAEAPQPSPAAAGTAYPPNTTPVAVTESVRAGDVLANDAARPGEMHPAAEAADAGVIGIVAGDAGQSWTTVAPVALPGTIVPCHADATYGAIAGNDLLVASPTPGHAMRAGASPKLGTIVGKALESLDAGTGTIRVLVLAH